VIASRAKHRLTDRFALPLAADHRPEFVDAHFDVPFLHTRQFSRDANCVGRSHLIGTAVTAAQAKETARRTTPDLVGGT